MDKLLPIGTIVKVNGIAASIMVVGFYPIDNKKKRMLQYYGVAFPLGVTDENTIMMFDGDEVDEIEKLGFEDEEGLSYNKKLFKLMELDHLKEEILREKFGEPSLE